MIATERSNPFLQESDTATLEFALKVEPSTYGNGKTSWHPYVQFLQGGAVVGSTDASAHGWRPDQPKSEAEAREKGAELIEQLKTRRLFVVRVESKHINGGEERNCSLCALALALADAAIRIVNPRVSSGYDAPYFRVETYACFVEAGGLVLQDYGQVYAHLPVDRLPEIVTPLERSDVGFWTENMVEWTMQWDDWAESQHMDLEEYRDEEIRKGNFEEDEREEIHPPREPSPCSFVLDVDAFVISDFEVGE